MFIDGDNYFRRDLVFQGGGALGAYEAGTYQQIYRKEKGKLGWKIV